MQMPDLRKWIVHSDCPVPCAGTHRTVLLPWHLISRALLMATLLGGCDFEAEALPTTSKPASIGTLESTQSLPDNQLTTRIRVSASAVEEREISAGATATGVIQAFRKSVVSAEVGGRVTVRRVEPGQRILQGQVLLELNAKRSQIAFDRATAEAQARNVDYAQAEHELLRGRRLIERNVISQDTLDDLRFNLDRAHSILAAANAQRDDAARILADSRIRAPFAGTAEVVHVQTGDYLNPGTPVVTLADFSKVRVIAGITANAAAGLTIGDTTRINIDSAGARSQASETTGSIQAIGRIADSNGTFPLELWIEGDAAKSLREGMIASVTLPQTGIEPIVAVPRGAVLRREGSMFVYVLGQGTAILRPVQLGRSDANYTQIVSGLEVGEQVIVEGLFALRDGAPVELLE